MGLFTMIADLFTGSAVTGLAETVKSYFPPGMSEAEQAELEMKIHQAQRRQEVELLRLASRAEAEFNDRIRDMEGTARDLKSIPLLGPLMVFMRGCQRPAWGFGALCADWMVFSGRWTVELSNASGWTPQGLALVAVNILVLGFLFGERAVQNVLPLLERLATARSAR